MLATANAGKNDTWPCHDKNVSPANNKINPIAAKCLYNPVSTCPDNIVRDAVQPMVNPAVQASNKKYWVAHKTAPMADQRRKSFSHAKQYDRHSTKIPTPPIA